MFWQLIDTHMAPPPEREIGSCVTSRLVEEVERLAAREQELLTLIRKVYEFEAYASKGTHPLLTEMREALRDDH